MRKLLLAIVMLSFICTPVFAKSKDYAKAKDIQKVNLGDTFEEVSEKIGDPNQILSKELTTDGKEKTTWLYESSARLDSFDGLLGPSAQDRLAMAQAEQLRRQSNPPYLVIFIDGKVSEITKQKP